MTTTALSLDPKTTALVLIDLQQGIVAGATAPYPANDVVAHAVTLAKRFRERGALVVLVRVDPGPDFALMPRPTADVPPPARTMTPDWATIVPALGPERTDVVVTKHQPNAFYSTDLEVHLARRGIRTIVLGGIATNIGVEATARAAHERGFDQLFVSDAMTARDEELHRVSVTKFFPTIGRVRNTRDIVAALG
jgi:nicotinamidase-related amidase